MPFTEYQNSLKRFVPNFVAHTGLLVLHMSRRVCQLSQWTMVCMMETRSKKLNGLPTTTTANLNPKFKDVCHPAYICPGGMATVAVDMGVYRIYGKQWPMGR